MLIKHAWSEDYHIEEKLNKQGHAINTQAQLDMARSDASGAVRRNEDLARKVEALEQAAERSEVKSAVPHDSVCRAVCTSDVGRMRCAGGACSGGMRAGQGG